MRGLRIRAVLRLLASSPYLHFFPLQNGAVLGLSGFVVDNIAFLFAAVYLYRLSLIVLKDPEAALRASILFCFNPASIFYSSIWQCRFLSLELCVLFVLLFHLLLFKHMANICLGRSVEETRPWCKVRGVGFLRYFQLKQLPNFLLAFPILSLAVCSIIYYAKLRSLLLCSFLCGQSQAQKVNLFWRKKLLFEVGIKSSLNDISQSCLRVTLKRL
ncbi:hypothetical protein LguiB_021101 [Lonicera macranthoides]